MSWRGTPRSESRCRRMSRISSASPCTNAWTRPRREPRRPDGRRQQPRVVLGPRAVQPQQVEVGGRLERELVVRAVAHQPDHRAGTGRQVGQRAGDRRAARTRHRRAGASRPWGRDGSRHPAPRRRARRPAGRRWPSARPRHPRGRRSRPSARSARRPTRARCSDGAPATPPAGGAPSSRPGRRPRRTARHRAAAPR